MGNGRRMAVAAAVTLWACGEGSTGPSAVASVEVTPATATLSAGQTVSLAAVARDASGRALTDRTITWSSDDVGFATVGSAGAVTGVAAGSVDITATAEGVDGSAIVTVLPRPVATITIEPPQISLLPGESAQLTATAHDAQNAPVPELTFSWISNDVSVATVDPSGLVTSVAPGAATVYAVAAGRSGGSDVGVLDPDAPRVLSVSPTELVEGAAATLDGVNFSTVLTENVVTIDGFLTTVTGASETTLDIVVPTLACRPRHLADLAVTVGPRTGRSEHPVRPAAAFQLAQGQLALLRDPTTYCLQFDASAADEEYLIGVQSTSYTPTSLTSVQVTSDKDATALAALVADRSAAPTIASSQAPDGLAARALEWRLREAEVMHREIEQARLLSRGARAAAAAPSAPALIPGDVSVGAQVVVRYPNLDFADTCQNYVLIQGTVRYVGATGIWVSDNANPGDGYTDSDYTDLGDEFEQDIYPTVTDYFGLPADEDANGRIVVVVTKEVNDDGIGGIVPGANLLPQATCPGSNEGEYFYMIAPDPDGEYDVGVLSSSQARRVSSSILGHELVHNVHLSRRDAAGHVYWDSWMHEGQATLGEEVMGHTLTPGRSAGQNYGWAVILNQDGAATRRWYYDAFAQLFRYYGWSGDGDPTISTDAGSDKLPNAPEGCTFLDTPSGTNAGLCADRGLLVYGVSWSFLRWLTDQYAAGLGGESAMHQAWIDGPLGGFPSIETLVGEDIETLLAQWAASLYVDDRPEVAGSLDPLLTLPSWDLFDVESHLAPEARLQPRVRAFDDFTQNVGVRAGSTAYFLVSGSNRPSTAIRMRAPSGGFLSPSVQVWVVRVR